MGDLKFVPQSLLDTWSDLGKIELTGNKLIIPNESISFTLTPAVRFLSLLEGEDAHKLLAKVKAEMFVKEIGGEVVTDSCLIGDTAYQVQPGYLAEAEALAAAQTARATHKLAPKPPAAKAAPSANVTTATPPPAPPRPVVAPTPKDEAEELPPFLVESLD